MSESTTSLPELSQIVEALVFASASPMTTAELAKAIRLAASAALEDQSAAAEPSPELPVASAAPAEENPAPEPVDAAPSETTDTDDLDAALDAVALGISEAAAHSLESLARTTDAEVLAALHLLVAQYEEMQRAFTLEERASGWRLFTKASYGRWVRGLFPDRRPQRLSAPALETLAIIAYRQPLTKASIEAVRGVSIDGPMQKLLDLNIVRVAGRADLPGRPLLYETTDLFFEHFGIKSIDDLPNASELRRIALPSAPEAAAENTTDQPELPLSENTSEAADASDGAEPPKKKKSKNKAASAESAEPAEAAPVAAVATADDISAEEASPIAEYSPPDDDDEGADAATESSDTESSS
jgi:segregation and condensation protein B